MGCIFCKLRPKAATTLTDSSLRLRTSCCNRFLYLQAKEIFGRHLKWKCLQAKTKDLPSESHSVQNISDPIGQNTSQVKQNCCSKVFWALTFQASRKFLEPQDILDFSELSRLPNAQKFVGAHQPHAEKMHILEKSLPKTNHPYVWIQMTQAHFSPESLAFKDIFTDWRKSRFWFHQWYAPCAVVGWASTILVFTPQSELCQ